MSTTRELYGILENMKNSSAIRSKWNAYFEEKGIDAFIDKYPTTIETIPERLSEMFHFDRRAYIVGDNLQEEVIPLLDESESKVNLIINDGGVMRGLWFDGDFEDVRKCTSVIV